MLNLKTILMLSTIVLLGVYCYILNKKINTLEDKIVIITKELKYKINEVDSLNSEIMILNIDMGRYDIILSRIDEKHHGIVDEAMRNLE